MVPIVFDVTITGDGLTNKKNLRKYQRIALKGILLYWLQKFFARHFETSAFFRYPSAYKSRLSDDSRRQAKMHKRIREGNIRPNYETGRMKRQLAGNFRITGTATSATLTMRGPPYTDIQGRNQPDKAAEIAFMSGIEQKELRRVFRDTLVTLINGDKTRRRIRIGGV